MVCHTFMHNQLTQRLHINTHFFPWMNADFTTVLLFGGRRWLTATLCNHKYRKCGSKKGLDQYPCSPVKSILIHVVVQTDHNRREIKIVQRHKKTPPNTSAGHWLLSENKTALHLSALWPLSDIRCSHHQFPAFSTFFSESSDLGQDIAFVHAQQLCTKLFNVCLPHTLNKLTVIWPKTSFCQARIHRGVLWWCTQRLTATDELTSRLRADCFGKAAIKWQTLGAGTVFGRWSIL